MKGLIYYFSDETNFHDCIVITPWPRALLQTSLDPDSSYCDNKEDHAEDEISSSNKSDDDIEERVVD